MLGSGVFGSLMAIYVRGSETKHVTVCENAKKNSIANTGNHRAHCHINENALLHILLLPGVATRARSRIVSG